VARSLFEAMPALGLDPGSPDDRGMLSREVIAAYAGARARIVPEHLPAPEPLVSACGIARSLAPAYDGRVIGAALEGWLAGLPAATRAAVCPRFVANLGDVGFPVEARTGCP
jgi:hypothetical protein